MRTAKNILRIGPDVVGSNPTTLTQRYFTAIIPNEKILSKLYISTLVIEKDANSKSLSEKIEDTNRILIEQKKDTDSKKKISCLVDAKMYLD